MGQGSREGRLPVPWPTWVTGVRESETRGHGVHHPSC